jgi:hypothetical protein
MKRIESLVTCVALKDSGGNTIHKDFSAVVGGPRAIDNNSAGFQAS